MASTRTCCVTGCVWSTGVRLHPICRIEEPSAPKPTREDFRRGDKVAFEDKCLQTVVGTIVRINERTATVDAGNGNSWRVGFALLRRVLDI